MWPSPGWTAAGVFECVRPPPAATMETLSRPNQTRTVFAKTRAAGPASMFETPSAPGSSSSRCLQDVATASALVFSLPMERVDKSSVHDLIMAVRERATSLHHGLHEVQAVERLAYSQGIKIHGSLVHEGAGSRSKGLIAVALRRSIALERAVSTVLDALGKWPAPAVISVLSRHASAVSDQTVEHLALQLGRPAVVRALERASYQAQSPTWCVVRRQVARAHGRCAAPGWVDPEETQRLERHIQRFRCDAPAASAALASSPRSGRTPAGASRPSSAPPRRRPPRSPHADYVAVARGYVHGMQLEDVVDAQVDPGLLALAYGRRRLLRHGFDVLRLGADGESAEKVTRSGDERTDVEQWRVALLELRRFSAMRTWQEWARHWCEAHATAAIITRLLRARRLLLVWRRMLDALERSRRIDGPAVRRQRPVEVAGKLRERNANGAAQVRAPPSWACEAALLPCSPSMYTFDVRAAQYDPSTPVAVADAVAMGKRRAEPPATVPDSEERAVVRASALLQQWG